MSAKLEKVLFHSQMPMYFQTKNIRKKIYYCVSHFNFKGFIAPTVLIRTIIPRKLLNKH